MVFELILYRAAAYLDVSVSDGFGHFSAPLVDLLQFHTRLLYFFLISTGLFGILRNNDISIYMRLSRRVMSRCPSVIAEMET